VERGYLAREPVDGDRRAIRLRITTDGTKALSAAEAAMAERLEPLVDGLDDQAGFVEDLDQIAAVLRARFAARDQQ
jgi:DNA-binding MarR family transcriptional regulator